MAWMRVRGRAHAALAARASRVALYDLRESIEQATGPLPIEFVAAVARIGDASALESLASAFSRTTDAWWREQLAGAFQAIAKRERITRRSAVLRQIERRRPGVLRTLLP
jgi:hypothetical protein